MAQTPNATPTLVKQLKLAIKEKNTSAIESLYVELRGTNHSFELDTLCGMVRIGASFKNVNILNYALSHYWDQTHPLSRYPHLFDQSKHAANNHKELNGISAWFYLFSNEGGIKHPNFKACADLLMQEKFSLHAQLPVQWEDPKSHRPLSLAIMYNQHELFARLINENQSSIHGFYEKATGLAMVMKPSISPLGVAIRFNRWKMALDLLRLGADPLQDKTSLTEAALKFLAPHKDLAKSALHGLRIAVKSDGWERALKTQEWQTITDSPMDRLNTLRLWFVKQALDTEAMAKEISLASKSKGPLSVFSRLLRRTRLEETPVFPQGQQDALKRLIAGDAYGFASTLKDLDSTQQFTLLLQALSLAKMGFWRMPPLGGVSDEGRDALSWSCFKSGLSCVSTEVLNMPIKALEGLSLMGLAAALGEADVCAELYNAGARVDPDSLLETTAPLALALHFHHSELAHQLLEAGANPLEGFQYSPFGMPSRSWAVHSAFETQHTSVLEALLEQEPLCAHLKNKQGQTMMERCDELLVPVSSPANEEEQNTKTWLLGVRSLIEAALISSTPPRVSRKTAESRSDSMPPDRDSDVSAPSVPSRSHSL